MTDFNVWGEGGRWEKHISNIKVYTIGIFPDRHANEKKVKF